MSRGFLKTIGLVFLTIFATAFIKLIMYPEIWTQIVDYFPPVAREKEPPPQAPIDITADQITADYNQNAVKADSLYKGKRIRVSGIIDSIGKDILDKPYVSLKSKGFREVECTIDDPSEVMDLKAGDAVCIQGIGDGMFTMVDMKQCHVVPQ